MWEVLLIIIGLAGFGATAWLDLKTTEFPDWIPYAMIGVTLCVRVIFDFSGLFDSIISGLVLLVFGLALYWFKQWGDGDAWLLGAMGFLFPTSLVNTLLVFFIAAFAYLIIYSIAIGLRHPVIFHSFFSQLRKDAKGFVSIIAGFTMADLATMAWLAWYVGIAVPALLPLLIFPALLAALLLFARYGRLVEQRVFKRQIDASKLRPDDVPMDSRWKSLTKKEIEKIRKRGGKIWIKEGVRFAPVFLISFVICFLI